MDGRFVRTERLIGNLAHEVLRNKHILIIGVGGVGGYAFECLVRAGVKKFTISDGDRVDISNLNRQIIALTSTVGEFKTDVAKRRAAEINPDIEVRAFNFNYNDETKHRILDTDYDYCIDCFDSVKQKLDFIETCYLKGLKLISAMGAGNRLNPEFKITDIFDTSYDPLARVIRTALKKTTVKALKTVCDTKPVTPREGAPASISYAPALMGCMIAGEVIRDLLSGFEINTF